MFKYGISAAALAIALAVVASVRVSASAAGEDAKAKLEILQKRLPGILATFTEKHNPVRHLRQGGSYSPKIRFIRMTSATTAKVTISLDYTPTTRAPFEGDIVSKTIRNVPSGNH
jgi:hypothetical protein